MNNDGDDSARVQELIHETSSGLNNHGSGQPDFDLDNNYAMPDSHYDQDQADGLQFDVLSDVYPQQQPHYNPNGFAANTYHGGELAFNEHNDNYLSAVVYQGSSNVLSVDPSQLPQPHYSVVEDTTTLHAHQDPQESKDLKTKELENLVDSLKKENTTLEQKVEARDAVCVIFLGMFEHITLATEGMLKHNQNLSEARTSGKVAGKKPTQKDDIARLQAAIQQSLKGFDTFQRTLDAVLKNVDIIIHKSDNSDHIATLNPALRQQTAKRPHSEIVLDTTEEADTVAKKAKPAAPRTRKPKVSASTTTAEAETPAVAPVEQIEPTPTAPKRKPRGRAAKSQNTPSTTSSNPTSVQATAITEDQTVNQPDNQQQAHTGARTENVAPTAQMTAGPGVPVFHPDWNFPVRAGDFQAGHDFNTSSQAQYSNEGLDHFESSLESSIQAPAELEADVPTCKQ